MVKWGLLIGTMVLGVTLSMPSAASAGVLKYCPSGNCNASGDANDLDDLDHHNFYVWKVNNINLGAGNTVKKATLTFKQMYNWDNTANELFLQLFDAAKTTGGTQMTGASNVRYMQDEASDTGPMSDVFNNGPYYTNSSTAAQLGNCTTGDATRRKNCEEQKLENNLIATGTAETYLTSSSFAALGDGPNIFPGEAALPPGWTVTPDGTTGGEQLYTYTYTFTEAQENALQSYIANGGNIAIGLDPDCHFYNNGVMLTLTTGPAIPEPASMLLLGTGLLGAIAYRRRRA